MLGLVAAVFIACSGDGDATSGSGGSSAASGGSSSGSGAGGATTSAGSGGSTVGSGGGTGGGGDVTMPPANAKFDYQLGGAYAPPAGATMVVRDRTASPEPGLYNVCYVNGFQAQPDETQWWLDNHPDLVLRDGQGDAIVDQDWNELLLDTSKAEALAMVIGPQVAQCATDGFDAVEIDNLDSYLRSQGELTQADNVAYMARLSAVAHQAGLAIAQKNAAELLGQRSAMGTDFVVSEECNRYDECQEFVDAYGDAVFVIEYRAQDFQKGCNDFSQLSIILRDLDLVTPSGGGYVYDDC